jgi:hypothetical protein
MMANVEGVAAARRGSRRAGEAKPANQLESSTSAASNRPSTIPSINAAHLDRKRLR